MQALRGEADGRALVLLDELGTGTDPMEGAALGVALLKRMVAGGCMSGVGEGVGCATLMLPCSAGRQRAADATSQCCVFKHLSRCMQHSHKVRLQ
jgi:hypothetical protein